jgi:NADH-quinone oxidoreductase subunit N
MLTPFFDRRDLPLIMPQVMLAFFGLGILLTDFLLEKQHKWMNAVMAMAGVGFSGFALWRLNTMLLRQNADAFIGFNDSVLVDPFFIFFGFLFLAATALVILLSVKYLEIEGEHHGEYYALMLFAAVGMMFLASGQDLIVLFIALETMAASFYVLTGFLRRDRRSNEGALKYVLLGAFSSGILAYGFSILYGISGTTNLQGVAAAVALRSAGDPLVLLALVTTSTGLFFKISAVPFHQWAPDVYEGAPTSITAYVSVASKAASFALLLRIFLIVFGTVRADWEWLLAAVALATLTVGNFAALTQTNVKRLLAYSSIAHAGYMLLGLVAGNPTGLKAMAFYLLIYTFMNVGAFAIVIMLRRQGLIGDELEDLNGLYRRNPAAAVLLLIFMLSLAGIPPTAGFLGKWFIFQSLIETGHYTLAVFAALYVVPGLYYYFRLIVHAWLSDSRDPVAPRMSLAQGIVLSIAAFVSLAGLLYAQPFVQLAQYAFASMYR